MCCNTHSVNYTVCKLTKNRALLCNLEKLSVLHKSLCKASPPHVAMMNDDSGPYLSLGPSQSRWG